MQTGATFLAYDYFPKPESLTSFPEMTAAQKIRVLIVDDHAMVRQGLRAVLQSYPNIEAKPPMEKREWRPYKSSSRLSS
jgi:hypothetical protein